jgi:hypothetical protein
VKYYNLPRVIGGGLKTNQIRAARSVIIVIQAAKTAQKNTHWIHWIESAGMGFCRVYPIKLYGLHWVKMGLEPIQAITVGATTQPG